MEEEKAKEKDSTEPVVMKDKKGQNVVDDDDDYPQQIDLGNSPPKLLQIGEGTPGWGWGKNEAVRVIYYG